MANVNDVAPAISVRPASEGDLDAIVELLAQIAAEDRWIATEIPFDRVARRSNIAKTLERPDARMLVATSGDTLVGNLGISAHRYGFYEFGMVATEGWRGRGVGSALLAACIAWSAEIGAHKITLDVFPHNAGARALYRKFGFTEEGYFRRHLRRNNGEYWDSIPMSLWL